MKYSSLIVVFLFLSCANKEDILLPKSNVTLAANVQDHSPIYIFFRTKGKDALAEVNRKSSIISTNWIFNIDKRLPLRIVLPEIIELQEKKRNEKAHKNEAAQNYYSYADSIGKNLAFVLFTKVYYKMMKPTHGILIYFTKDNLILVNGVQVAQSELEDYLKNFPSDKSNQFIVCFAKDLSFENYIQDKIVLQRLKVPPINGKGTNPEFIY